MDTSPQVDVSAQSSSYALGMSSTEDVASSRPLRAGSHNEVFGEDLSRASSAHMTPYRTYSYGAAQFFPDDPGQGFWLMELDKHHGQFHVDAICYMLIWFLCSLPLFTLGVMFDPILGVVAVIYGLTVSIVFVLCSRASSQAWRYYTRLCLVCMLASIALSVAVRILVPPEVYEDQFGDQLSLTNRQALRITLGVSGILMVLLVGWCKIATSMGYKLVGSCYKPDKSQAPADAGEAWDWQPEIAADMLGATASEAQAFHRERHHSNSRITWDLAHLQAYWSGELPFDYAFWIANQTHFLGAFFGHSLHPLKTFERFVVLLVTVSLVVFPVAALSSLLNRDIVRTLIQVALITGPRNALRAYIRGTILQEYQLSSEAAVRSAKLKMRRAMMVANPTHSWGHMGRMAQATIQEEHNDELVDSARMYSLILVLVGIGTSVLVAVCSCLWILHEGLPLNIALWESCDGIGFALIVELFIQTVFMARQQGNARLRTGRFFGVFSMWHHEWSVTKEKGHSSSNAMASPTGHASSSEQAEPTLMWPPTPR